VAIFVDAKGNAKMEPFLTGLVENNKYLGRPADVAPVVQYLASDEASWVTAQTWVVDGGSAPS